MGAAHTTGRSTLPRGFRVDGALAAGSDGGVTRPRFAPLTAALLLALVGPACAELPAIDRGECGNALVEKSSEDCDTFAAEPGTYCRPAGSENACRYDCATDKKGTEHACPSGWACGDDGLCRVAKGSFSALGSPVEEDAQRFDLADFDGDGRQDVLALGGSGQRVHFFDSAGLLAKTFDIPGAPFTHATGSFTGGDTRADLVIGVRYGISVMRGQSGRTLSPTQYPFITAPVEDSPGTVPWLFAADGVPEEVGEELYAVVPAAGNKYVVGIVQGNAELSTSYLLDKGPDSLAGGTVLSERLEPTSPCETLIFGFGGEDHLELVTPCRHGLADERLSVTLEDGGELSGRIFLVDLDGNGIRDVVAGTSAPCAVGGGRCCSTHIALTVYDAATGLYGLTSDLSFATVNNQALLAGLESGTDGLCTYGAQNELPPFHPLAVEDVNQDGSVDILTPYGLYISDPLTGGATVYPPSGSYWTDGVFADLTGDGIVDAVAGSRERSGLELFIGDGQSFMNLHPVPTQRPVDAFGVGDFDGDLVQDLAFSELAFADPDAPANTTGDTLSVLYGKPLAPPEPPIQMGRLDAVAQVVPVRLGQFPAGPDGFSDLTLVTLRGSPVVPSVLLFAGSADRLLVSPFLIDLSSNSLATPVRIVGGRFDGSGQEGVLALTVTIDETGDFDQVGAYWMLTTDEASFTADKAKAVALPEAFTADLHTQGLSDVVALDLDGDGVDEAIALTSERPGPDAVGPDSRVLVTLRALASGGAAWTVDEPTISQAERPWNVLAGTADVDANGLEDLYVIYIGSDYTSEVVVFWNDGNGTLSAAASSTIPMAITDEQTGAIDPYAYGVTFVNVDADPELEAVPSSYTATYRADLDPETRSFGAPSVLRSLPAGPVVAAGDVDGDGIGDVVIGDGASLSLYRGLPRRE